MPSRLGHGRTLDLDVRNSLSWRGEGEPPWRAVLAERVRAMVPEWRAALGLSDFKLGDIELDMVVYNDGAFYGRHTDLATGTHRSTAQQVDGKAGKDRMITAVYYFHGEPKGFGGGALRLHPLAAPATEPRFADIPPDQNSLAVFPAWVPHEVMPVRCPSGKFADSRFAINCWVRRAPQ